MITFKSLYQSARLRSLPLSFSGILTGSAISLSEGNFNLKIFILALFTTLLYQLLSDFANDYGDAKKGTDNENRVGPKRAIQNGSITLSEMKKIVIFTAFLSLLSTIFLVFVSFEKDFWYILLFLCLGILAIWAAMAYTMGKKPYGYSGLGDLFVFIFFGNVSVLGSYFLYSHRFSSENLLLSTALGLLCVAVLNLNNMRDIENDKIMGKRTIPVKIGFELSKFYHYFLILIPMILLMSYSILKFEFGMKVLYMISFIPLIIHLFYVKKVKENKQYDSQLKVVALSTFLFSLLFFVSRFF